MARTAQEIMQMIEQEGKHYVPLQTLNDFLVAPLLESFLFNGKALILANDDYLFDYREGEYTPLAEFYYDVPRAQRSDALAEYGYNELCLVLDKQKTGMEILEIRQKKEISYTIKRGNVSQSRFLNHYSSDTVRKQHTVPLHQRA